VADNARLKTELTRLERELNAANEKVVSEKTRADQVVANAGKDLQIVELQTKLHAAAMVLKRGAPGPSGTEVPVTPGAPGDGTPVAPPLNLADEFDKFMNSSMLPAKR
jgi:hypothetical protein